MTSAKVVTDSKMSEGHRLTALEVVMPRYILAEFNTHRMLSKNSASSRAIPFNKMVKSVQENPFIPYAFQKNHTGMQGTEYLDMTKLYSIDEFMENTHTILSRSEYKDHDDYVKQSEKYSEKLTLISDILNKGVLDASIIDEKKTLVDWWLFARDRAVECASILYIFDVTKQLANRLLEPFMYHKVLVSGTEWENFFNLRCPEYEIEFNTEPAKTKEQFKSWKEVTKRCNVKEMNNASILQKLQHNKGQADIHMMFLAEAIYDAINESTPRELKDGEWHIPYGDNMDVESDDFYAVYQRYTSRAKETEDRINEIKLKISISRCARLSYQTLGDNPVIDYAKDLTLYEVLSKSGHWSPFEHVAKAMNDLEYKDFTKTSSQYDMEENYYAGHKIDKGWCRNFRGFIQYRELLD